MKTVRNVAFSTRQYYSSVIEFKAEIRLMEGSQTREKDKLRKNSRMRRRWGGVRAEEKNPWEFLREGGKRCNCVEFIHMKTMSS